MIDFLVCSSFPYKSAFCFANSLSISRKYNVFTIRISNSLWITLCFTNSLWIKYFSANSLYIFYQFAKIVWVHYLFHFRGFTMNYYQLRFYIWRIYYKIKLHSISQFHYELIFYFASSLSISRKYNEFTICFVNSLFSLSNY